MLRPSPTPSVAIVRSAARRGPARPSADRRGEERRGGVAGPVPARPRAQRSGRARRGARPAPARGRAAASGPSRTVPAASEAAESADLEMSLSEHIS